MAGRQVLRAIAQVPLAEHSGRVTEVAQRLGDRHFLVLDAAHEVREQNPGPIAVEPVAHRQPPGQQPRPARRTDRSRDVEVRPALTLRGHPIEVRGPDHRRAVAAEIAPTQVVGEHDDEVGGAVRGRRHLHLPRSACAQERTHEEHPGSNRPIFPQSHEDFASLQRQTVKRCSSSISSGSVPLWARMPGMILFLTPMPRAST